MNSKILVTFNGTCRVNVIAVVSRPHPLLLVTAVSPIVLFPVVPLCCRSPYPRRHRTRFLCAELFVVGAGASVHHHRRVFVLVVMVLGRTQLL